MVARGPEKITMRGLRSAVMRGSPEGRSSGRGEFAGAHDDVVLGEQLPEQWLDVAVEGRQVVEPVDEGELDTVQPLVDDAAGDLLGDRLRRAAQRQSGSETDHPAVEQVLLAPLVGRAV